MAEPPPKPSRSARHRRHLRWLRDELPHLVDVGVLDPATAGRLREHYGLGALGPPRNPALLAFALLGALLVGGGLILIVGHNWDQLSRLSRAALSLALLLAAQGLAAFSLLRRPGSAAWTESSALLLTLCIGASTALISQTYNVQSETGDFVLSWLLLALPVPYVLQARVAAAAYLMLCLWLPHARHGLVDAGYGYVPMAGAALPLVARVSRAHSGQVRTLLLQWVCCISVPAGLMMLLFGGSSGRADELALPLLSGLFVAMHWLGSQRVEAGGVALALRTPVTTCGLLGLLVLALVMTFTDPWPWASPPELAEPKLLAALALTLTLTALAVVAAAHALRRRELDRALLYGLPVLAVVGITIHAASGSALAVIALGNAYALALAVALLAAGLRAHSLRRTNLGMALVAALFVARFVDIDVSMLARGVVMVLVGLAFVGVNIWLVRRPRRTPDATRPQEPRP